MVQENRKMLRGAMNEECKYSNTALPFIAFFAQRWTRSNFSIQLTYLLSLTLLLCYHIHPFLPSSTLAVITSSPTRPVRSLRLITPFLERASSLDRSLARSVWPYKFHYGRLVVKKSTIVLRSRVPICALASNLPILLHSRIEVRCWIRPIVW